MTRQADLAPCWSMLISIFSQLFNQQLSPRLAASRSRSRRKSRSAGSVHNLKDFLPWELWHFGTQFVSLHIIGRPRTQLCPHPNTRSQPAGDCRKLAEVEKEAWVFPVFWLEKVFVLLKKAPEQSKIHGANISDSVQRFAAFCAIWSLRDGATTYSNCCSLLACWKLKAFSTKITTEFL